jgi:hypothetical protein
LSSSLRRLRPVIRLRALRYLAEPGLPTIRGAGWAVLALHRLRREIPSEGLDVRVRAPRTASPRGVRGVEAALRLRRATCLERSLIVQRWLMTSGSPHDVLVGVNGDAQSMEAHAWIDRYDSEDEGEGEGFRVLTRVAPRE